MGTNQSDKTLEMGTKPCTKALLSPTLKAQEARQIPKPPIAALEPKKFADLTTFRTKALGPWRSSTPLGPEWRLWDVDPRAPSPKPSEPEALNP